MGRERSEALYAIIHNYKFVIQKARVPKPPTQLDFQIIVGFRGQEYMKDPEAPSTGLFVRSSASIVAETFIK